MTNIFADIPAALPEELVETLKETASVRIERIVSQGHTSPPGFWYDQDTNEWVVLLQGAALIRFEGDEKSVEMTPGSFVDIPAHKKHRIEWTDPVQLTVWLAVHYKLEGSPPAAVILK